MSLLFNYRCEIHVQLFYALVYDEYLGRSLRYLLLRWVYLHVKGEGATMANAFWVDAYSSSTLLNYLLDNSQPKADALVIQVCRSMQLAELWKQFVLVFLRNTRSGVDHVSA